MLFVGVCNNVFIGANEHKELDMTTYQDIKSMDSETIWSKIKSGEISEKQFVKYIDEMGKSCYESGMMHHDKVVSKKVGYHEQEIEKALNDISIDYSYPHSLQFPVEDYVEDAI